ncbi:MAG: hypothetical protein LBH28_08220 [Oscillospiraceae bacterium]|nr:hypothetical protein [Oscillospiraceae bacterium]
MTDEGARTVGCEYDANNQLLAEHSDNGTSVRTTRMGAARAGGGACGFGALQV